jgi:hypothetical protein
MLLFASTISGTYPDIVEKTFQEIFLNFLLVAGWGWLAIDVFYPPGETKLLGGAGWLLRCALLAVY